MSTRKIADLPLVERCRDREHNPPSHMVFQPGIYEHTCPSCGNVIQFVVPEGPSLLAATGRTDG